MSELVVVPEPRGGWSVSPAWRGSRLPTAVVRLRRELRAHHPAAAKRLGELIASQDEMIALHALKLMLEYSAPKPREPKDDTTTSEALIIANGELDAMRATARKIVEALEQFPECQEAVLEALGPQGEQDAGKQEASSPAPDSSHGSGGPQQTPR